MVFFKQILLSCVLPIAFASAAAAAGPAIDEDAGHFACTTQPRSDWLNREMISQRIAAAGYKTVVILDIQGSCYHVRALTTKKLQAEVYLNPVTGDVVSAELFDE